MRVGLQEELDQLEASLQEEGELVRRALRGALNALEQQDEELADEVIAFDDEVDRCYFGIETGIQSLLARQAPAAMDLRLALAILHDNLHLERMADYCVTVAKLTKLSRIDTPDATLMEGFEEMGSRAEDMTALALRLLLRARRGRRGGASSISTSSSTAPTGASSSTCSRSAETPTCGNGVCA